MGLETPKCVNEHCFCHMYILCFLLVKFELEARLSLSLKTQLFGFCYFIFFTEALVISDLKTASSFYQEKMENNLVKSNK